MWFRFYPVMLALNNPCKANIFCTVFSDESESGSVRVRLFAAPWTMQCDSQANTEVGVSHGVFNRGATQVSTG